VAPGQILGGVADEMPLEQRPVSLGLGGRYLLFHRHPGSNATLIAWLSAA
jgi:hypothetical protein